MQRRKILSAAIGLEAARLAPSATARSWPTQALRVIVPFAAGGGTDVATRIVLPVAAELLGQPVVIDNQAGAGGTLGYAELARARPDGHTMGIAGTNLAYMNLLHPKLGFDPVADLVAVAPLAGVTIALAVHPALPVRDLRELAAHAKARGAPLPYATAGVSTPQHLAGELLARTLGVPMTHVPYKGTAPAIADVLGGHVPLIVIGLPSVLPYLKSQQLKVLGVAAARRSALAPELPTMAEAGLDAFEAGFWYDVRVPRGTPQAVVDLLQQAITRAVASAPVHAALLKAGFEPMIAEPEAYQRALRADGEKWVGVVKQHGIRGE